MKDVFYFLFAVFNIIVFIPQSIAQAGFSKVYGNAYEQIQSSSIIETYDNNFIIAGNRNYKNFVMKIDSAGNIVWNKSYGVSQYEPSSKIISLFDSTYFIASSSYLSEAQQYRLNFIKLDSDGDTLWSSNLSIDEFNSLYSVEQTYDSGFMLIGRKSSDPPPYNKMFIIKLDKLAQFEWAKTMTALNNSNTATSIQETEDSCFLVCGIAYNSNPGYSRLILMKISFAGDVVWSRSYDYQNANWNEGDVYILDDSYLIAAISDHGMLLIKTGLQGNVLWSKKYDGYTGFYGNTSYIEIHQLSNNRFAILVPDFLYKTDSSGYVIWSTFFDMYVSGFKETNSNGFLVCGNGPIYGVKSPLYGEPQIGLVKLDSSGVNNAECIYGGSSNYDEIIVTTDTIQIVSEDFLLDNVYDTLRFSSGFLNVSDKCVDFIGSTKDDVAKEKISIFPNPTDGVFEIQSVENEIIEKVQIINSKGLGIYESTNLSLPKLQIDISEEKTGIYYLRISMENSVIFKKLIIR
ncbi:MAG: T9SS type A sorting domain-containing protein [Chlorobi bacterium]|nr:T9SS type A sorting domain-containing protein [Chlorobiota bacterium]